MTFVAVGLERAGKRAILCGGFVGETALGTTVAGLIAVGGSMAGKLRV